MTDFLFDPDEALPDRHARLLTIAEALMRRVEQDMDGTGDGYAQFERAVMLEDQVRQRTMELEHALDLLNRSNAQLAEASREADTARANLDNAIEAVREGFALFDAEDRLVMRNRRFGQQLRDIEARLTPGISFEEYVALVSRSNYLAMPQGPAREAYATRRLQRHQEPQVMFNVELTDDHWLQVSEHRTPDGGTVMLHTDITDIMRLEREEREKLLDEQARMVRATLDHLNQGVAIFDRGARLMGWNQRLTDLFHLPAGFLHIGLRFDRIAARLRETYAVSEPALLDRLENWAGQADPNRPLSFELQGDEGETFDIFARRLPDQGFVMSVTDVTAMREAARALATANETLEARVTERTLELEDALESAERANASKSRFVAAASHDLLQPLSAAKLYLASADGAGDDPLLGKAERALLSVEQIIEALLDISKLDSGRAQFDRRQVDVSEVFVPLREEFGPLAAAKGLDLRIVECGGAVETDAFYLKRILQNLVSNAIRYTDRGKVLVGARRMGGALRFEVWDTGRGIAEADQEAIFQEFKRLDSKASASEGLGLGLAIVERACARLGHPLGLWSEPGRGSGFFVNVPRAARSVQTAQDCGGGRAALWRLKNKGLIVLLVEDDADLRRALSVLLGKWDISVLDAASGEAALDLLDEIEITPDAALVDYQLGPGIDGVTLAGKLAERHGPVPVCMLSANRTPEFRQRCHEAGLPLLSKPVDAGQLETMLVEMVGV